MEKGDIFTLIGGFVIVLVIAGPVKPGGFSALLPAPATVAPTPVPVTPPVPTTLIPVTILNMTPVVSVATTVPIPEPYRIFYTSNPFTYPVVRLPVNMETFGVSDNPLRSQKTVTFAFIEESRGGVTQTFSVPYDIWMMNISVDAGTHPQYGRFQMVLCDAKTGAVLEGADILYYGTMYRKVQYSDTPMYMIITMSSIGRFRINFETPQTDYDAQRPK